jgi:hypothetical protein
MSTFTRRDADHVFEALRKGLVPERGIDAFAVGIEKPRGELRRQLDLAEAGEGTIKFLRGGYGCGKTFMARLAVLDAQARGFATSFVVVSDSDLRFHRFDDVYRKVMTELSTLSCPRGALGDILDRWIGLVEDGLISNGHDESASDFDEQVKARLDADLEAMTGGAAPADFVRVIQTIFTLKQQGEVAEAGALISWLSGSGNVSAAAKKTAGIKGDIESRAALDYLRGVLAIVHAAGYKGLLIIIDEAETILRMRSDSRHKSLNGIRQIADAAASYPRLLWLFTGTPEFYDSRHGVAGLAPLDDRIRFLETNGFASLRQAQLALKPFDKDRLIKVAMRLRELFPAGDRARLERCISAEFIAQVVADVTAGFKNDVGIVPRQFLRAFVTQMDLVDEHDDYDPMTAYRFEHEALTPEEQHMLTGEPLGPAPDEGEDLTPQEDVW